MTLKHRVLAEARRGRLKALLQAGRKIRAIETHNPLSAIIGATASIEGPDGGAKAFDAQWLSGFPCRTPS